ncbi:Na(+)-translocating NADH-quinone reductase subunit F [Bacteroidia bacterium]|nr:Na(+)-translocating NADH-quinone reductase subunit F [Bacteroidia bacterium]
MTIVVGTVVFLVVILLLVGLLLFVKAILTPSGNLKIVINGEKELEVPVGGTLLASLQSNKIFLSGACGGSGSCGQCRCQVIEGGGEILPTEVGFFSRKQIKDHWRLGCQTRVKDNLNIRVPESVFGVKEWECEVVSNNNVSTFIKEFVVKLPAGEHLNFKPGSYIQIQVPDTDVVRAYSMANYPAEGDIVMLNVRIANPPIDRATGKWKAGVPPGICSTYIFGLHAGDRVRLSGPYGDFHILDTKREMLYIGGGAGMAPLRSQLLHLFHTLKTTDRKISYWYGARSKAEIFYEEDFRTIEQQFPNFTFTIALSEPQPEDNWTGATGFIHQVIFDKYLSTHEAPEDIEYYMCGPTPMANAVKTMLDNLGVPPEMLLFDDFG